MLVLGASLVTCSLLTMLKPKKPKKPKKPNATLYFEAHLLKRTPTQIPTGTWYLVPGTKYI